MRYKVGYKNVILASTALLVFLVIGSVAGAAVYREIDLKRAETETRAHGYITMEPVGFVPYDIQLHVDGFSLRPGASYDVWIVDRKTGKRTPAGFKGKNNFRTNFGGAGHYTYRTTEFELGWNKLEVREHATEGENPEEKRLVLWTWLYQ